VENQEHWPVAIVGLRARGGQVEFDCLAVNRRGPVCGASVTPGMVHAFRETVDANGQLEKALEAVQSDGAFELDAGDSFFVDSSRLRMVRPGPGLPRGRSGPRGPLPLPLPLSLPLPLPLPLPMSLRAALLPHRSRSRLSTGC
jgi:hypothetical protein